MVSSLRLESQSLEIKMRLFAIYNPSNADPAATPVLEGLAKMVGFLPNVFAVMGNAPAALMGFTEVTKRFGTTNLSPTEREIVHIATSVENGCEYCVAGHTAFAKMQNIDENVIAAVRDGERIDNPKYAALHNLCCALVRDRGHINRDVLDQFVAAGYSQDQLLEVILGIGEKTISNLTSVALNIPLDEAFAPFAWTPNSRQKAA